MVSWGQNQTFTVPSSTSTPPAAGSGPAPIPATPNPFGASPAPAFSFGRTPAPAPTKGLFGQSPAPSGSFFGASPAPTPSTGTNFFGNTAPSPGVFGNPTPSAFGAVGSSASQSASIPAQAALQAHHDAFARQEAQKVQKELEKLCTAYSGQSQTQSFVTIVYNEMTPEQYQWHSAQLTAGTQPVPPQPPQVPQRKWLEAVIHNPDPERYIPVAIVGAEALQGRIAWQQQRSQHLLQGACQVRDAQDTMNNQLQHYKNRLAELKRDHEIRRAKLLHIMRKLEVLRCINIPIQQGEVKLMEKFRSLKSHVDNLENALDKLQRRSVPDGKLRSLQVPDRDNLFQVLTGQREQIILLSTTTQRDRRDLSLLQERLAS